MIRQGTAMLSGRVVPCPLFRKGGEGKRLVDSAVGVEWRRRWEVEQSWRLSQHQQQQQHARIKPPPPWHDMRRSEWEYKAAQK